MEPDYAKMYALLRGCVEDALDCLPEKTGTLGSRLILQMALRRTREMCAVGADEETGKSRQKRGLPPKNSRQDGKKRETPARTYKS